MSQSLVQTFTHLKDKPKSDQALHLLQRIASLVKPIMRKHHWKLPTLSEFYPDNPSLLGMNVNGGQKILVRLRHPFASDTFLDENDLVGTMLHELTHNVHGPHDGKFYKLLGELEDEYANLRTSGYSGEGFLSNGQRVGTGVSHNLPPHLARAKAAEAAENRHKLRTVMGGTGRKLGGKLSNDLSPRELAAQAAERRASDDRACGFGYDEGVKRESDNALHDSIEDRAIDIIDLTDDLPGGNGDDDERKEASPRRTYYPTAQAIKPPVEHTSVGPARHATIPLPSSPSSTSSSGTSKRQLDPSPSTTPMKRSRYDAFWSCSKCTFHNELREATCKMCGAARPEQGWTCHACIEVDIPRERWSCPFCGTIKRNS